ncbi:MMPL family transporter [Nocardia cyriacigeorgica]|uniref:MMPL family transporter n=1 Tax=Nocardia cyriacigeorgica TaxID=135487 RepID=UPI0013D8BE75|nr:MMPL family transporter [Nocardia cyriacigeorgica]NEW27223.1 MMPL family transporter [Nocardia cyriacigeorgica]
MITRLTGVATAAPKLLLTIVGVAFVVFGALGSLVTDRLSAGGFTSPDAESSRAAEVLAEEFGITGMQLILAVDADSASSPATSARAVEIVTRLRGEPDISGAISPWTEPAVAPELISDDGRTGLIVAAVRGDDNSAPAAAAALVDRYTGEHDGLTIRAGGQAVVFHEANSQAARDLALAEAIALPLCFLLSTWFLRSAIAAAIPVLVGAVSIVTTTAILYALTFVVELSIFAMNLTTAIGLALAIDYSLLIISRYREEIAGGHEPTAALTVAMRHGGRAVCYSGITVAIGVVAMVFFPLSFLRSVAFAGVAVVGLSVLLTLTMVPALLAVLGARINRKPLREATPVAETRLYRIARAVQARPLAWAVPIVLVLLALGAPVTGMRLGLPDERVLPAEATAHQVGDDVRQRFGANPTGVVQIVLTGPTESHALGAYAARLSEVAGVTDVTSASGIFVDGRRVADGEAAMASPAAAHLTVSTTSNPYSEGARDQLDDLRAVDAPAPALFGGLAQQTRDTASGISDAFPKALIWIAVVTFALLLLLTGSLVLPLKALVLNTLSLSATFGALVWIFQDGHFAGLGTAAPGYLAATVPALVFCTAFGLSMDYEVFLLTRFREEWDRSGKTRADNDTAVAVGIARSGRVITAAAALMAVVFAAVISSDLSLLRAFGLGLTLAVLVDATLVRLVLVPAFMRVAGTWNWWAPRRLRPALDTFALRE